MKTITEQQKEDFLNDIKVVYKKHNLALGHEDSQGSFVVVNFHPFFVEWLFQASIDVEWDRTWTEWAVNSKIK